MNKLNWTVDTPLPILALKLLEEAAEVGTQVTDGWKDDTLDIHCINSELDQVEYLASVIRAKVNHG